MRQKTAPLVLLTTFMMACATGKTLDTFDTSRPIQIDGGTYRQRDQPIPVNILEEKLSAHPVAGPKMSGFKAKKWTGLLLGSVGGGIVGWNVGENLTKEGDKNWMPSLVGAGAIVLAIPFALMADGQMRSAVEAYNGSFTQEQSKVLGGAVPFIAVLPAPAGGKQCRAGFTMSF